MGWKTIRGRRYFYEDVYVDGERTWKCWSDTMEAIRACERVKKAQLEKSSDIAVVQGWEVRDRAIDRKTSFLDNLIRREMNRRMREAGYHQHKWEWRKRQVRFRFDSPALDEAGALGSAKRGETICQQQRIEEMSEENFEPLAELKDEIMVGPGASTAGLADVTDLEEEVRDLALAALRGLETKDEKEKSTLYCKVDETMQEVRDKVRAMREQFDHPNSTQFEKMLVEQIVTAWVQWYVASWLLESKHCATRSWRQNQYLERRYLRCQVRLSRAIDQLARIRQVSRHYLENGRR